MRVRSWLSGPTFIKAFVENANRAEADVAVLDLEDSVAEHRKDEARRAYLDHCGKASAAVIALRINSLASTDGLRDLLFLVDHAVIPDIVILAKARLPSDVLIAQAVLRRDEPGLQLFAVVESAQALHELRTLQTRPAGLSGIIFGSADFAADCGLRLKRADLSYARAEIALAAKRLRLAVIDAPCFELHDEHELRSELHQARRLGYDGKIALHPSQVASINAGLDPSADDLENAALTLRSLESAPEEGVLAVDGSMIGPPFRRYAQRVLGGRPPAHAERQHDVVTP